MIMDKPLSLDDLKDIPDKYLEDAYIVLGDSFSYYKHFKHIKQGELAYGFTTEQCLPGTQATVYTKQEALNLLATKDPTENPKIWMVSGVKQSETPEITDVPNYEQHKDDFSCTLQVTKDSEAIPVELENGEYVELEEGEQSQDFSGTDDSDRNRDEGVELSF